MPNKSSEESLRELLCAEANHELAAAANIIRHCLDQLTVDQVWWRPDPSMNSIGNLILHVCGNVRQWIVCGLGSEPDSRRRQLEFDQRQPLSHDELMQLVTSTLDSAHKTLGTVTSADLLAEKTIQGTNVNGMRALMHSVSHFRGHVQEMVHLARVQLGRAYQFDFEPRTAAEGTAEE